MDKELYNLLIDRYPTLLPPRFGYGFQIEDGWFTIIDCLSLVLLDLKMPVKYNQIKEKYATLRAYLFVNASEYQAQVVDPKYAGGEWHPDHALTCLAECFSERVCESCGAMGQIFNVGGKWMTSCVPCVDSFAKERGKKYSAYHELAEEDGRSTMGIKERLKLDQNTAANFIRDYYEREFLLGKDNTKIEFPARLFDIVDCTMRIIRNRDLKVKEISWHWETGLFIDLSDNVVDTKMIWNGLSRFARLIASWTNLSSGQLKLSA